MLEKIENKSDELSREEKESVKPKKRNIFSANEIFRLKGRIGRVRYFGLFVAWSFIFVFSNLFLNSLAGENNLVNDVLGFVALLLLLSAILNLIFLQIRRLNDFDTSGYWILIGFFIHGIRVSAPIASYIVSFGFLLLLFLYPGTKGKNKYGEESSALVKGDYIRLSISVVLALIIITINIMPLYK